MNRTLRYLSVTAIAAGLAAGIAWGAKGGGKPGGGDTTSPDKVGVIADFDDSPSHIDADGRYDATSIGDGWVEMPGSGNFVLNPGSTRILEVDLRSPIGQPPTGDNEPARAYQDFVQAHPTGIVPVGIVSINKHCKVQHIMNSDDPDSQNYYVCGDPAAAEGSLKAMQYEETGHNHGTDLLLWVSPRFPNPYRSNAQFQVNCGFQTGSPVVNNNVSFMVGHCSAPLSASDPTCAEWRIVPNKDKVVDEGPPPVLGLDLGPITTQSEANACTLVEYYSKGRTSTTTTIMDFDLSFGLTVYRDENRDGVPD